MTVSGSYSDEALEMMILSHFTKLVVHLENGNPGSYATGR